MLKKITLASLLAACLITVGCANKVPDNFVSFSDADLGLKFSYPPEWGEVNVDGPSANLVTVSFENKDVQPPLITLLQKSGSGNTTEFFTTFNESAAADCKVFEAEAADATFACEAVNLNNQAQFLYSENMLGVPVAEYRFVFGKELAYQSGVAIKPITSKADLKTVLKTIEITKTGAFEAEKRARPVNNNFVNFDHELISFDYPKTWEVKMEGTDVLLVTPKNTDNDAEPVPLKIKIWPSHNDVNVDQFKQTVTPKLQDLSGHSWQVFRNFPGVYTLDLWFLPYQNKMIEITTLASTDANYDAQVATILNTLTLK